MALIAGASVIALSLPNSFAAPISVTSPMKEPEPFYKEENGTWHLRTFLVLQRGENDCFLYQQDLFFLNHANVSISKNTGFYGVLTSESTIDNKSTTTVYDVFTGTVLEHAEFTHTRGINLVAGLSPDYSFGTYMPQGYYFPSNHPYIGAYVITSVPIGYSPTTLNDEPFVTWSIGVAEQTSYYSSLSEPIADKYNAYFILNDRLVWVSYKINTYYQLQNTVENESETYNSTGLITEQGSSAYVEHESISWDNDFIGDHTFQGRYNSGTYDFYGALSNLSGNIYGLCTFNSNGTLSFDNKLYYPVSYNSSVYSDPYELCLTLETNQEIHLNFIRHSSLSGVLLDANVFMSEFDLRNGAYVKSWTKHVVSDLMNKTGWTISLSEGNVVESLRCYGCAFLNENNIPVNLSSVIWQYDVNFAEWRDGISVMLDKIYKSLSGEEVETETYTQPSWNNELNEAEPRSYVSQNEIMSVFDGGIDNVKFTPEAQQSITSWVDMFSVPKLIAACCFALAMGTVILTLGKKKSD